MSGAIVVGLRGETAAYVAAGLRCYEPDAGRLVERVLAERARCAVLAMTRRAHDALPPSLARDLRQAEWPVLAILPAQASAETAPAIVAGLLERAPERLTEAA